MDGDEGAMARCHHGIAARAGMHEPVDELTDRPKHRHAEHSQRMARFFAGHPGSGALNET